MDADTGYLLNEEARHEEGQCDVCKKWFNEFDLEEVEGIRVCLGCNDHKELRNEGHIRRVSERTKELAS